MRTAKAVVVCVGLILAASASRADQNPAPAAAPAAPAPPAAKPVEAGPKRAEVAVGEIFQVSLPCNPTTGFRWELKSLDQGVAAPTGPFAFHRDPVVEGVVGAGGSCVVWIQGVKPGKTSAVMIYRRPWEKRDPIKTFTTEIKVVAKK
jgi:predicted secreted protein